METASSYTCGSQSALWVHSEWVMNLWSIAFLRFVKEKTLVLNLSSLLSSISQWRAVLHRFFSKSVIKPSCLSCTLSLQYFLFYWTVSTVVRKFFFFSFCVRKLKVAQWLSLSPHRKKVLSLYPHTDGRDGKNMVVKLVMISHQRENLVLRPDQLGTTDSDLCVGRYNSQ